VLQSLSQPQQGRIDGWINVWILFWKKTNFILAFHETSKNANVISSNQFILNSWPIKLIQTMGLISKVAV